MHTAGEFYDELGEGYEQMIDWGARLGREGPHLKKIFEKHGVGSVLDVACGTGQHAIEFARWGLRSAGCDISAEMLRLARRNAEEAGVTVDFIEAGLTEIDKKAGARGFDAVLCIGNSLPHLLTQRDLDRAARSIRKTLAPGGVFISQMRNYERILRDNLRFMAPTSAEYDGGECVFFRFLDIHGSRSIDFHLVRMTRESGKWKHNVQTMRLRPITREHLNKALGRAGFKNIRHHADYALTRFGINKTLDLITIASCAS